MSFKPFTEKNLEEKIWNLFDFRSFKMKRIRNNESSIIFRFCNPLHKKKINVLILFMYIVQDEQKFLVNNSRRINPCFRT